MAADGQPSKRPPENGSINPHKAGYYMLSIRRCGRISSFPGFQNHPKCNSGIFVRTFPLEKINARTSHERIEMQILDSTDAGYYDTGIYDLVKPRETP